MAVATNASIKTQLEAGSFPDNTLSEDNIFDYVQYESRRRYPSCEVSTIQPESTTETKKSTEYTVGFEIKYFTRGLGVRTDEVATQATVEAVIMTQMESLVLQDHKIIFESKTWSRQQINKEPGHPAYLISVLRITIRQITATTAVVDGTLAFQKIGSTVDNAPGANFTYTNVYDVDFDVGYRTIEEGVVGSNIPLKFAGHLQGSFICNILVNSTDLGTTGDKLNKMPLLNTNGEKQKYKFIYTNKTNNSSTITNTFTCEPTSVKMVYSTREGVVYKLIAKLISDNVVTIS